MTSSYRCVGSKRTYRKYIATSDAATPRCGLTEYLGVPRRGKPLMILNKGTPASKCAKERARWYRMAGGTRRRHPTGGFARPFQLLASGLCTRVDMYGFSFQPDSSGKYFDKKKAVVSTHLTHFEHWAYRYLMQQGKLCVYGE